MACLLKMTMISKQALGLVWNNTRAYVELGEMLPAWMRGIMRLSTGEDDSDGQLPTRSTDDGRDDGGIASTSSWPAPRRFWRLKTCEHGSSLWCEGRRTLDPPHRLFQYEYASTESSYIRKRNDCIHVYVYTLFKSLHFCSLMNKDWTGSGRGIVL